MSHSALRKQAAAVAAVLLAFAALAPVACRSGGPAADVLAVVEEAAARMEAGDIDGVMRCLDDGYADRASRSKADIRALVEGYVGTRSGIVARVLRSEVLTVDGGFASVRVEAALSSGAARILRKLIAAAGTLYRFDIELSGGDGGWLITAADWAEIEPADLTAEAAAALRKLWGH